MRVETNAPIVSIDSFGEHDLIVASEQGEITLTCTDSPIERTKNGARITRVLSIDKNTSLVFTERQNGKSSATAYHGQALQQISGLTLHEVLGGASMNQRRKTVAIYTSAALRMLKFDLKEEFKAKILRTIEIRNLRECCCSPNSHDLLVATETEYQLINIDSGRKSPLFPILNGVKPVMTAFGEDFLVVQGTGEGEPAMGLFVDVGGEITCAGNVVEWPTYPTSLAASGALIFAVSNGELKIHRVEDTKVREEPSSSGLFEGRKLKFVRKLTHPILQLSQELLKRLGEAEIAQVETDIVFLLADETIQLWNPTPRLVQLEHQIDANLLSTVEPDPRYSNSEQGSVELSYISLYLILHLLDENRVSAALKESGGVTIKFELLLYIYGQSDKTPFGLFPGLAALVESVRAKGLTGSLDPSFLVHTLKVLIKKSRKDASKLQETQKLELHLAKQMLRNPRYQRDLRRFLLEKDLKARASILDLMHATKRYSELEEYYSISGKVNNLLKLWLSILRDPESSATRIADAALMLKENADRIEAEKSGDFELWDIVMELIKNERVDSQLGVDLLRSPVFEQNYDPIETLQALKDHTESGKAWRDYLGYLVYSKGILRDDLVDLLVADITRIVGSPDVLVVVKASYTAFAERKWPSPSFQEWLSSYALPSLQYPAYLLQLQEELWDLMTNELDWVQLMPPFDSQLHELKAERALIYKKLGLHAQSLELLLDIKDYRSIIDYASSFSDSSTRRDVAYLSFRILLRDLNGHVRDSSSDLASILSEFLAKRSLDFQLSTVLDMLDPSIPLYVVADFAVCKLRDCQSSERFARALYASAKAACQSMPNKPASKAKMPKT